MRWQTGAVQLSPSYGSEPILELDGSPSEVVAPTLRQQRRLLDRVSTFTDEQWAHPSRCEGWTTREVIVHLTDVTSFWTASLTAGLGGEPTRFLDGFDPSATPPQLVAASDGIAPSEVLTRYAGAVGSFTELVAGLDDVGLGMLAEAPPGHLRISAVAHHALWDSWTHERDIVLPLGLTPEVEADEVAAGLRYVAGLTAALAVLGGAESEGRFAVEVIDPDLAFRVEVDGRVHVRTGTDGAEADQRFRGDAVGLLEAFSLRAPLDQLVSQGAEGLLGGLAQTFDVASG